MTDEEDKAKVECERAVRQLTAATDLLERVYGAAAVNTALLGEAKGILAGRDGADPRTMHIAGIIATEPYAPRPEEIVEELLHLAIHALRSRLIGRLAADVSVLVLADRRRWR